MTIKGWLDAVRFGPVAHLGWEAVRSMISVDGEVNGVCVGTGMGFDPFYYYYRPVSPKAAHGYGVTILDGCEIYDLISRYYPRINDSAVHYYNKDPEATTPIFSLNKDGEAEEIKH